MDPSNWGLFFVVLQDNVPLVFWRRVGFFWGLGRSKVRAGGTEPRGISHISCQPNILRCMPQRVSRRALRVPRVPQYSLAYDACHAVLFYLGVLLTVLASPCVMLHAS